jgi:adenine-specific DNA methylase
MIWDFAEVNLLTDNGWAGAVEWVAKVLSATSKANLKPGTVANASATSHPLPSNSVEAVITDPPYYAAIPYADLSDFFYTWLKRSVGHIHASLFADMLSPKEAECVSLSHRAAMYRHKDRAWFENTMTKACDEARRITKPNGISVVVFANKETEGWEAMLGSLVRAGWTITASWPIDTEMGNRMRAQNSAALASSVHLVCRPREDAEGSLRTTDIGDWRDVLAELPTRIHQWMPRLAAENVVGADAIFACLGPALEIFSRYSRVEKSKAHPAEARAGL